MNRYTLLYYIVFALLLLTTSCKDGNAFGDGFLPSLALEEDEIEPVTPTQAYVTPEVTTVSFSSEAASQTITVSANSRYYIECKSNWLTVVPTNNEYIYQALTITVDENTTSEARTAEITLFKQNGDLTRTTMATITVHQDAGYAYIIPSEEAISFGHETSSHEITVSTNVTYLYESSATWLTLTPSDDYSTLTINVEENTETTERQATIFLSYNTAATRSSASATITVTQDANVVFEPTELYYVGDATTWTFAPMASIGNGQFVGFYYIYNDAGFKFCANNANWEQQYGQGNGDFKLAYGTNDVSLDPCYLPSGYASGFYQITVDSRNLTYSLVPITVVSLIGGMNAWIGDYDMTFNTNKMCWEGTYDMPVTEFKFRANHDWEINWGGTANALTSQGDNLTINEPGNYTFELYPQCDGQGYVTITRNGEMAKGSGTVDDPYNVTAILRIATSLSADERTSEAYYFKGKVVSVKEAFSTPYGNAIFYISDDGTSSNQLYVYRCLYLNNQKFVTGDTQIQVGDDVIICGKLTNYKGSTPETVQGSTYLYSLNGKTSNSDSDGENETAEETISNGDFETWVDGLPTGWQSKSTASNANLSQSTDAHSGSYSVNVEGTTAANKRIAHEEILLTAGSYTVSFWAKAATGVGCTIRPGYVPVTNDMVGSYIYGDYVNDLTNTEWTHVTYSFSLSSATTVCLIIMNAKIPGGNALIDNYTITKDE